MSKLKTVIKVAGGVVCSIPLIIALVIAGGQVHTSQQGLELIGNAEGCHRDPYQCPSDVLTVGIGSTAASGNAILRGKIYSDQEIADRWQKDLIIAERCVNQYANGRNMPQGAFDALTSITFNVGCNRLRKSTLFKLAQTGYSHTMCGEFNKWVYAGGKKLSGLVKRRAKETALCLQG
ncbi:lysozyme [[Pasteurella] aerogenes]